MNLRTDLAAEMHEIRCKEQSGGVLFKKYKDRGVVITEIEVQNEQGEKLIGSPAGRYYTFDVTPFSVGRNLFSLPELTVISDYIRKLLPDDGSPVLVAGLGNDEITADSIGPRTASMIFSTRHISGDVFPSLGKVRSVAAVSTGVLGKTGIEAAEAIRSLVREIRPCAVLTVDALAARRFERLGKTVQLSTAGIVPGSGVGNSRKAINRATVGVPVLSVGVPTVVDGATFAGDILSSSGEKSYEIAAGEITVTPKDIDIMTERASRLIAMSINCALQKNLSPEEIFAIVSE